MSKKWDTFTVEERPLMLLEAWKKQSSSAKWGYDWWVSLFKETGFITNAGLAQPSKEIRLYRGSKDAFKQGMPWTDDPKIAEIFAKREETKKHPAKVYTTIVKPELVLAIVYCKVDLFTYITEYVVNYQELSEDQIEVYDPKNTLEGKAIAEIIRARDKGVISEAQAFQIMKCLG